MNYIISEEELNKIVYFLEHLSGFETFINNLKSKQPVELLAEGEVHSKYSYAHNQSEITVGDVNLSNYFDDKYRTNVKLYSEVQK